MCVDESAYVRGLRGDVSIYTGVLRITFQVKYNIC